MKLGLTAVQVSPADQAKLGIMRHAHECEAALRQADFATREGMPDVAEGLRKLAAYHSDHAFRWAVRLAYVEAGS